MSVTNYNLNKSAENMLGPSIVKVLQDNLGIESQQIERKQTTCGRKTTRGKSIESLEGPCSSEINLTAKKKCSQIFQLTILKKKQWESKG